MDYENAIDTLDMYMDCYCETRECEVCETKRQIIKALEQMKQLEEAKGELPEKKSASNGNGYRITESRNMYCKGFNECYDVITPIYLKVAVERDALKAKLLSLINFEPLNNNTEVS